MDSETAKTGAARVATSKHFLPAILFTLCFGAYVGNGDFLPGNDQVGNMLFSVNLLKRHSFAISPPVAPQAFFWSIAKPGQESVPTAIDDWTKSTAAAYPAYREGRLSCAIAVQFVGAYSYSLMGWSDPWRDYDRPEQASLWRWDRPQIDYDLANFSSERARNN